MIWRRHRIPDDISPEEREARIAELRARRRARARKRAIRSAIGTVALTILAAFALYWLLTTFGGRDFLLAQIVARLPAGTTLTWQRAEGPAAGPLTMYGVRYVQHGCPDRDGEPVPYGQCAHPTTLVFTAKRVAIDPDVRPLLGRLLRLDALDIDDATLELPKSDEPFELPRWPDVLPRIELPLALQADTIRIDGFRVSQAGEALIDVRSVRGGLDARQGRLHVEHLVVDSDRGHFSLHGDYAPRDDYRTAFTASALLPAPLGRTRPRIGFAARGDLAKMDVAVSGNAPKPLRALLTLRGEDDPHWTFTANSAALDPSLLAGSGEAGVPLAFDVNARGIGGAADLQGRLTRTPPDGAPLVVVVQPSKVRLVDQVLAFEPLVVDAFGGRVTARGRGDFSDREHANFKFSVDARDLVFGAVAATKGQAAEPGIGAQANFGVAGTAKAWAAIGNATLTRDQQRATIAFDGRGDAEKMALKTLHVAMPTGTLDARGEVGWTPALRWKLDAALAGFDPGYFAHDWKGAVNGTLASTGGIRDDGGLDVDASAERLGGTLRGRKLDGRAAFKMRGAADARTASEYSGDVALTLGDSRIDAKGKVAKTLDIDAKLSPLQLADFLPGSAGELRGTLALSGTRDAPNVDVDLAGSGIKYGDYAAAALTAKGRLPWKSANGTLAIAAQGVQAGVALDTLRVDAKGAIENLDAQASARGEIGALDVAGHVERRGQSWRGTLASLHLAPAKGAAWRLRAPAQFAQTGANWTLSQSCFASDAGGSLCADADWPRRGLNVAGTGLPLALAMPYLPERDDGRPWILRGEIALDAHVKPAGAAYQGNVRLTSASGGLRMSERARNDVIDYADLALNASFDARRIQATLASKFNDQGRIDARVDTGWDAYAPLAGEIAIDTSELTWLELFSPDIVDPTGKLAGRVTLAGTRAQPALGGRAQLSDFSTELPALGIVLQDGNVALDAQADGNARIDGRVRSGDGVLNIDGTLGWRSDGTPLELHLRGDNVLVSDTRDLRAVAAPDLTVRYTAAQPLSVTGTVKVPSALIDLERLDQGVSASPDVVVLDPVDPEKTGSSPLDLDLALAMGDDVKLKGFGLDGTLGGQLRVRARPGREMTATGALEVGGRYTAYGQKLQITRGTLSWSNGPVSDPILDIRAERRIESEDVTAGIDVTGRASQPQANVWTDPATDDSEALSYLALGRSTSNLSSDESSQLNAASAALTAGGSVLASQIGSKLGLEDAGVSESRTLGGSVLGIGKQLSPRLYVGFGVSLLGTGQVLTLKYLLRKGFNVEIESSTLESRGSINYRHEK
jgi:translocation and assembly module TamB